jgi:hypothetical protein
MYAMVVAAGLLRRRGELVLADGAVAIGVERAEEAINLGGIGLGSEGALELLI